jgi:hypothetical protein
MKILRVYEINDDRLQKIWSIALESRIFRIIWSFIEFTKNDDLDDSSMRRFIISVISSMIDDSSSILSSLRDDLFWSFLFLIRHICIQWSILWQSKHSELIVEHSSFEWLTRSHLMHFLSSFESFFLFSFFLFSRLLLFWLFPLISSLLIKFTTLSVRWRFFSSARF